MKRTILTRTIIVLLLTGSLLAAIGGHIDSGLRRAGLGRIETGNDLYLEDAFDEAIQGFLVLSAIKSGLAVIEGSEVGVGFSLELGDIVQSVYDYVDIAWKTVLAGGTVLLLTKMALDGADLVDRWCLAITLVAALMTVAAGWCLPHRHRLQHVLEETVLFMTVVTASLYVVMPLAIQGAAALSARISRPVIEASQAEFAGVKDAFSAEQLKARLFPPEDRDRQGWFAQLSRATDVEALKERFRETAAFLQDKTRDMAVWTIRLIAGYIFDCIVFPIAFFLILYLFAKGMVVYLIGLRRSHRWRAEGLPESR